MKQEYIDTVRLLIDIAPDVFASPRLAMKGGTARQWATRRMASSTQGR